MPCGCGIPKAVFVGDVCPGSVPGRIYEVTLRLCATVVSIERRPIGRFYAGQCENCERVYWGLMTLVGKHKVEMQEARA